MESLNVDGDRRDLPSSSAASAEQAIHDEPAHDELADLPPDAIGALALLGLGLLLESSTWVARQANPPSRTGDVAAYDGRSDVPQEHVTRRALVGLIVETRARARSRREAARQARRDFLRRLSEAAAPVTNWLPVEVTLTAAEILADYGQKTVTKTVARLAQHGRIEEEEARALAQQAILGWMDEAITYATRNPAVRDLVAQHGEELAASALDDLRTRSESMDTWLAQATRKVLKRSIPAHAPAAGEKTLGTAPIAASGSGA